MVFNRHIYVHKPYHTYHQNQMHVHVIVHDIPYCITTLMHQCMFIFIYMFMVFKQSKDLTSIKEIK